MISNKQQDIDCNNKSIRNKNINLWKEQRSISLSKMR